MARTLAIVVLITACGGEDSATIDAPRSRWTWMFVDTAGNDVGCPLDVSSVELTMWSYPQSPGDSCTNGANATVIHRASFPCAAGEAYTSSGGNPRLDFMLPDGRVYARFLYPDPQISVVTPRGFVALHWSFYNPTIMMDRWCSATSVVDATWLGQFASLPCGQSAPTMAILPGQPVGERTFDAWVGSGYERCGLIQQSQTVAATVSADQVTDVSVQFTTVVQ